MDTEGAKLSACIIDNYVFMIKECFHIGITILVSQIKQNTGHVGIQNQSRWI